MPMYVIWYKRDMRLTDCNLRAPKTVRREDYEHVASTRAYELEGIFHQFNADSGSRLPIELSIRSMMSGDIVEDEAGTLWFCKSIGWEEVAWAETEHLVGIMGMSCVPKVNRIRDDELAFVRELKTDRLTHRGMMIGLHDCVLDEDDDPDNGDAY